MKGVTIDATPTAVSAEDLSLRKAKNENAATMMELCRASATMSDPPPGREPRSASAAEHWRGSNGNGGRRV
jgi:hypothetical protein